MGLGEVLNSEYSNAGELYGLNGYFDNSLMGELAQMNPITRAKAINAITRPPAASRGSRAEFEKFFGELPDHIKEGLKNGKLRLADKTIYSIKPVNGAKTIKMFESQDVKEVGLRNISNGKLPKNSVMLVSAIYLLQGTPATAAADDVKSTVFDIIDTKGALNTGEFTFKANKKHLLSETSLKKFHTGNLTIVPKGYYKLDNPRPILDDVDIEFDIELGTVTGLAALAHLYVGLEGTITIPN
jgi:hypothetical protein